MPGSVIGRKDFSKTLKTVKTVAMLCKNNPGQSAVLVGCLILPGTIIIIDTSMFLKHANT